MNLSIQNEQSNWILSDIENDFKKYTCHNIVKLKDNPSTLWCLNLFEFPSVFGRIPKTCKSFINIHHINEGNIKEYNFDIFNKANGCIVCNKQVEKIAAKYIKIPIHRLSYWILSKNMKERDEDRIKDLKCKLLDDNELLVGSFQKDGNGRNGDSPKMSKGPDVLIDLLDKLNKKIKIKVVLAGYARNYVISKLKEKNIAYVYLQNYKDITSLYDCLDWYFVTSRYEGGPQSILEASYRKIKILSTNVGVASEILHPDCICLDINDFINKVLSNIDKIDYNYKSIIDRYLPQSVISIWDRFFENA